MPDKGGYGAVRNRTLLLHLTLLERDELSSNIEPTMRTYPCNPTKGESARPPATLGIFESPLGALSQTGASGVSVATPQPTLDASSRSFWASILELRRSCSHPQTRNIILWGCPLTPSDPIAFISQGENLLAV